VPPPHPPRPEAAQFSAAELEARRARSALLRAYEQSTITRANFCVLKRISEADLEAQLAVARQERAQEPPPPPRRDDERGPWRNDRSARPDSRPDRRPDPRGDFRGGDRGHPGGAPRRDDRGPRPPQGKPPVKPTR
jgi:hypothetical protein